MNARSDPSPSLVRERFASDLMFSVGRYHHEDAVDARFEEAAGLLRQANIEVERLQRSLKSADETIESLFEQNDRFRAELGLPDEGRER
jgi:hypothetical protein